MIHADYDDNGIFLGYWMALGYWSLKINNCPDPVLDRLHADENLTFVMERGQCFCQSVDSEAFWRPQLWKSASPASRIAA
jgi:hypothetical protein